MQTLHRLWRTCLGGEGAYRPVPSRTGLVVYDYGYDSCWTYDGWQWIYVCGDYAY